MVLGFGSGERFKEPKELTPGIHVATKVLSRTHVYIYDNHRAGPGQYNSDDPRYKTNAEIKSSFMGGERFTPDSKEGVCADALHQLV